MGPRGVGNPPHSSLPPPRPPDPSQFKLKLQAHKHEVSTRFSEFRQSMTTLAAEQEEFRHELREELRQLRLSYGEPPSRQPHSNPSTTTISAPPPSSSAGNPSSPSYGQSQLLKCQLPEPPPIQPQIPDPKPPPSFTLPQAVANPTHTQIITDTAPPQNLPPPLSVVKPISISENSKPKFHSPLILSPQATTKKDPTVLFELNNSRKDMVKRIHCKRSLGIDVSKPIRWMGRHLGTGRNAKIQHKGGSHTSRFYQKVFEPMSALYQRHMGEQGRKIQATFEDLKKIENGQELQQSFSGVDKRVRDKGGGRTFQLGNNPKVITTISHDPQYWKSVLNGFIWSVFEHRSEHNVHAGNALLNVNYKVLLNGDGWLVHLQLVTKIKLMTLKVDKAFRISSLITYDGTGHQFILMVVEQIKCVFNKLCADLQTQEEMKAVSYKIVEAPKSDTWAELICINGLNSTVPMSSEFKLISFYVGSWSIVQFIGVFIQLFVKVLIAETSVGEICDMKLNVEFFGNNMESDGQCFREPFSSLQFCESPVNLNVLKAQFRSSNKGDFTYVMCLENWIERTVGNASKLSVGQATKGSGKSEVLILDQETNFQQRVFYDLEKAIGLLKNNFGLSFASIALYHGDYEHKQLKFGLVLGLFVYTSIMQPEHEYVIGSNMNQFYNPNCGVKWVRVVHICNQPSNSSIEVIGFLITLLQVHIILIPFLIGTAWPFNALGFVFHLRTCKPVGQVMHVDYALAILMKEGLYSTLKFNIYTIMLPKEFYIGSSLGVMEVIGVRNALLWDKVLIGETLIKSLSVQNFNSEAFEINCEVINYNSQLRINLCAVTDNCSFRESEMESLYELIIDDPYNLIGQHGSMFLWRTSASVKPDLKLLFRIAQNLKTTGNLLYNALYEVLCITLITASSFNKARKIIMVISNVVHEPYKTPYVQALIEVCKTLQLVEDEITKLGGLFDNGPMHFPHIKSAPTPLRNSLKLSLEHSKQVKVFSLQVSHKKNICQQRCSYLAESKISQDAATHANTFGMRYWFSWKLLRYANTTFLTKNMMVGPQYDLMNGSFSWVTVHKLKEVIRNAEQWIEESCMEYQVGQTVIKFSLPFLSETHELKFTLVKLKLMELISVFEIASDNEEQGTQYTKSCSGLDQSMKLGSHFEKWHQSNATAPFGSQCVLGNKAAAAIVACGVIALAKQEESTWVCLLLLVYISLEKHEDMLYFKGSGLLGSYFYGTLYWTSYCHAAHVYLLAQSLYETHRITKALYAAFW